MISKIVQVQEIITLLGGGEVSEDDLTLARRLAPRLVAADGGADHALAAGWMPEAVIGDFDSVSDKARTAIPAARLHPIANQDTTDFDKCLDHVSAPLMLGLGFLGARLDHAMAVLSGLLRQPGQRCLLLGQEDVTFLCPPTLSLTLPVGSRFSLYPMAPVRGVSRGLEWPIDGIDFAPGERLGTSNRVVGPVTLEMEAACMLVILPRDNLTEAIKALHPTG